MRPSPRLRVLLLGALLVGTAVSVPAGAAGPTTLTGTAGSWVSVSVPRELVLKASLPQVSALTADRGSFVGFSLVNAASTDALTYLTGRYANHVCTFDARCSTWEWPSATGMERSGDGSFVVPAGQYRFVLLGATGARLSLRSTFSFLRRATRTTAQGRMQVRSLTSTVPPAGDAQPTADGAASFESTGVSVTGVVFRLDTEVAKDASIDMCVGSDATALPHLATCDLRNGGQSEGAGIFWAQCGDPLPSVVCLPASTTPDSVTHGLGALVRKGSHASFDLMVKAEKSRTYGWAFSFQF